jgi:hypothetical protein
MGNGPFLGCSGNPVGQFLPHSSTQEALAVHASNDCRLTPALLGFRCLKGNVRRCFISGLTICMRPTCIFVAL